MVFVIAVPAFAAIATGQLAECGLTAVAPAAGQIWRASFGQQ